MLTKMMIWAWENYPWRKNLAQVREEACLRE